jgi:TRAP-type C4-dicarboxylate transport system substrate-binding protein
LCNVVFSLSFLVTKQDITMKTTNLLRALSLVSLAALPSFSALADSKQLRVGTWLSPNHTMNADVIPTWGEWIEQATDGRVTVKIEYNMGHPKSLVDLVEDGAVDAAWTFHGYIPGRFQLPQMVELPGVKAGAEAVSVAHWRINQEYFAKSGENDGVELAALFVHGPGHIHLRQPVDSLESVKGLKIRIGGGVSTEIGKRLGVTGVNAPATKAYELLAQGVADGIFMQMDYMRVGRYKEVAPYTIKMPHGMYLGSFGMFLSPDFMSSLSEEDRQAIRQVSGEKLSALAGRAWATADDIGEADIRATGSTVVEATDSDIAYFEKITEGMDEEWIKKANRRGVDAKTALHAFRQEAELYQPLELP